MIKLRPSASPEVEDGCARSSPHVVQPRIAVTAAKRGRLRWLLSQRTVLLCPLAVLTVLLLLDMARRALGGGHSSGWLSAARQGSSRSAWVRDMSDMAAWRVADAQIALLTRRPQRGHDEYGQPSLESLCSLAGAGQDPGWPLLPTSGYANASCLCSALASLPARLRVYTYRLPRALRSTGLLPLLAPSFNRGYPVEEYTLRHLSRGVYAERVPQRATAFLLPVQPYAMRVAAFPGDGLVTVQQRVAAAVEAVKALYPAYWTARGGCDQVLVSAHDKGGRVVQLADKALISRGVLVVNTADTVGDANEWGRYTHGKDVAGIVSFSTSLPAWAARLSACQPGRVAPLQRTQLASFVGGGMGAVRQQLFAHLAAHPFPELAVHHGHVAPQQYMRILLTSRYCLHVRGTQVQSPRLIEIILFGCVPVVLADTYDLPLSDVLDWSAFSVRVPQGEPEKLQAALAEADYESLRRGVCAVRRFFTFHRTPTSGDAFHMTALELGRRLEASRGRPECGSLQAKAKAAARLAHYH